MEKPKIRNSTSASRGKRNRTAGHNYERQLAQEFRDILSDRDCRTTRQASRLLDSCKVDLDCYFANVQAKNVQTTINYTNLLYEIKTALEETLPARANLPIAIFHKRRGNELVIMKKEDYYKIMEAYKKSIDEDN